MDPLLEVRDLVKLFPIRGSRSVVQAVSGVTRDLVRRVYEHKQKAVPSFTARYEVDRLVWFECYDDPMNAIEREKEIKKWRRAWKIALIEKANSQWRDLYPEILT